METKDIVLSILPILTLVLGAYLNHKLGEKSKKTEHVLKYKEEKYANMIMHLQGFVGQTATADLKRKFFEEQYKSWLYASDKVILSVNTLVELLIDEDGKSPDPKKGRETTGNIILEMRRDLLGDTNLKSTDFRYTDVVNRKN